MISFEEKRAAYEEARQILLLQKKWAQLMPGERMPDFRRAAKAVISRALGKQVVPMEPSLDIHDGLMHEHAPREAALIERTLQNGLVHPDVLHSYRDNRVARGKRKAFFEKPVPTADTPDVIHYVQYGSSDLTYPHGHLQGYGFVPSQHEVASHVQLEDSVRPATDAVPTKGSAAAGSAYH